MFITVSAGIEAYVHMEGEDSLQALANPSDAGDVLIMYPLHLEQRQVNMGSKEEPELKTEQVAKLTLLRLRNGVESLIYLRESYRLELINEWERRAGITAANAA